MKRRSFTKSILILCFLMSWIVLSMVWQTNRLRQLKKKFGYLWGIGYGNVFYMFCATMVLFGIRMCLR